MVICLGVVGSLKVKWIRGQWCLRTREHCCKQAIYSMADNGVMIPVWLSRALTNICRFISGTACSALSEQENACDKTQFLCYTMHASSKEQ
jgi:hypothetical protein